MIVLGAFIAFVIRKKLKSSSSAQDFAPNQASAHGNETLASQSKNHSLDVAAYSEHQTADIHDAHHVHGDVINNDTSNSDTSDSTVINDSIITSDSIVTSDNDNLDTSLDNDTFVSPAHENSESNIDDSIHSIVNINDAAEHLDFETVVTDIELLEIFLEEARELEIEIAKSFANWLNNLEDDEAIKELQRYVHTIKGGARMSGISSMGDLAAEIEGTYKKFLNDSIVPSAQWQYVLNEAQNTLFAQIDLVEKQQKSFFVVATIAELSKYQLVKTLPEQVTLTTPNMLMVN